MITNDQIKLFLPVFFAQTPTLLACLAAFIVIGIRWKHGANSSLLALLGFGLVFVLCFATPLSYAKSMTMPQAQRISWMTSYALVRTDLEMVSYVFLLVAIFIGRSKSPA